MLRHQSIDSPWRCCERIRLTIEAIGQITLREATEGGAAAPLGANDPIGVREGSGAQRSEVAREARAAECEAHYLSAALSAQVKLAYGFRVSKISGVTHPRRAVADAFPSQRRAVADAFPSSSLTSAFSSS